jgi:hypothetical protein
VSGLPAAVQDRAWKERILQDEKEYKRRTLFLDLWPGILRPDITHRDVEREFFSARYINPERLVQLALEQDCKGISWTYNEPTLWLEYTLDSAKILEATACFLASSSRGRRFPFSHSPGQPGGKNPGQESEQVPVPTNPRNSNQKGEEQPSVEEEDDPGQEQGFQLFAKYPARDHESNQAEY